MQPSTLKKFTIGFSPCPNDTFIFDALVNKKIDTGNLEFEAALEDVQTLNDWAKKGKLDITKLSYGVLPLVLEKYIVLNSGSALGSGVGPILITNNDNGKKPVEEETVAIPGENTTAHLLFSLAFPHANKKMFLRYDEIESYVLSGKGPGVIIHENRFTYEEKGLRKIIDLGDYWEKETGCAIPLGGIVIKRNIDNKLLHQIDSLIRKSIDYAYSQYPQLNDYIRMHALEMSEDVMRKHIDLYVNAYSKNLGEEGKLSVYKLLDVYNQLHKTTINSQHIFVPQN